MNEMLLICENNICKVYDDDGDNYRIVMENEEDRLLSKELHLPFPLAACLKYDMTPVDIDYLNKLSDSLDAWYKKRGV